MSLDALLSANDLDVVSFESAEAFLDQCDSGISGCLVVDIRMPGMDGLTLQDELKRRGISLPIIVITGHGDIDLAVRAMKAGALDFLEKPFDEAVTLAAIRRASEHSQSAGRRDAYNARIDRLTPREREVFRQLVIGGSNKEIARELGMTPRTAEVHRARVMEKIEADNLSHLVRIALAADFDIGDDDRSGDPA
jgi:two-component system response regulator FixJ